MRKKNLYICFMQRIDTNILFDGHKVYVIPQEGDVLILCKGVKGLSSQVKSFLKKDIPGLTYYFGSRPIQYDINGKVQIDCLSDSKDKIQDILMFCDNLHVS